VYAANTGLVSFANPLPASVNAGYITTASISYLQPSSPVSISATTNATNDTVPANNRQAISIAALATDMRVSLSAPVSAPVGTPVKATASFANIGANAAVNPTVTLQLSSGLSGVSVNSNVLGIGAYSADTGLVSFATPLPASLPAGASLSAAISYLQSSSPVGITATTSATNDTVPANNKIATVVQSLFSDIAVAIAPMAPTPAGNTTTGVITVSNLGGATASFLSSATVNGAPQTQHFTLAPNGVATYMVVVPVTTAGATVTAVVGSTTVPDSNPANNTASATVKPLFADVTTRIALPASAQVNTAVLGTVVFANSAIAGATAANTVGTVTLSNGQVMGYPVGDLAPGASAVRTFTVTIPDSVATSVLLGASTVATSTPETDANNNTATAAMTMLAPDSSVSGRVFIDANRNRIYDAGERVLPGYRVELIKTSGAVNTLVGSAVSDASGNYRIDKQYPATGYRLLFRDPAGNMVGGTPFNQAGATANGNPSTGSNSQSIAVSPANPEVVAGFIDNLTLYAGDNSIGQDLPLDPSGIVYDSVTRQPIAGATVRLVGPPGFDATKHLVGGSNPVTTGESGLYKFLFVNRPPSGVYTLEVTAPGGYLPQNAVLGGVTLPQGTLVVPPVATEVQPQGAAPALGVNGSNAIGLPGTQHFLSFKFNFDTRGEVLNNHLPLDPAGAQAIFIEKRADKTQAEIGDSVLYRIKLKNPNTFSVPLIKIFDRLPLGFKLIGGTSTLQQGAATAVPLADNTIAGFPGSALTFAAGNLAANSELVVTYRVRVGVGADKGTGVNTAQATDGSGTIKSLVARAVVRVKRGVFTTEACVFGKVYVGCDPDVRSKGEPGIPGVRLYLEDGTNITTDENGQYSICGLRPITHVLKIDPASTPRGARFGITSSRNAGDGDSLFLDLKNGELHRADFRETSCLPSVLEQVQMRRRSGVFYEPGAKGESNAAQFNSNQHKPGSVPISDGAHRDGVTKGVSK
jgi:large repetitive protein